MLENLAAADLIRHLVLTEKKDLSDFAWPDRNRHKMRGQPAGKTVDFTFTEDGHEVGVDFIELHESERHARQLAEMGSLPHRIETELGPKIRALTQHSIAASWALRWLPELKEIRRGEEIVKQAILSAVPTVAPGEQVDIDAMPEWVAELTVTCYASETPVFGFISHHEEQTSWLGQAAESMAEFLLNSSKPAQLASFSDARVVAIDRALMPIPGELARALEAREERIPPNWQAIYWVVPGAAHGSFVKVWARRRCLPEGAIRVPEIGGGAALTGTV